MRRRGIILGGCRVAGFQNCAEQGRRAQAEIAHGVSLRRYGENTRPGAGCVKRRGRVFRQNITPPHRRRATVPMAGHAPTPCYKTHQHSGLRSIVAAASENRPPRSKDRSHANSQHQSGQFRRENISGPFRKPAWKVRSAHFPNDILYQHGGHVASTTRSRADNDGAGVSKWDCPRGSIGLRGTPPPDFIR